jgi:hypothetical protein
MPEVAAHRITGPTLAVAKRQGRAGTMSICDEQTRHDYKQRHDQTATTFRIVMTAELQGPVHKRNHQNTDRDLQNLT